MVTSRRIQQPKMTAFTNTMRIMLIAMVSIVVLLSPTAEGHGQLTFPVPRPDVNGQTVSSGQREPTFTMNGPRLASWGGQGYYNTSYRCHGFTNPSAQITTLVAGAPLTVEWWFEANHPGDCFLYLSEPGQSMTDPSKWYKIAQFPGCGSNTGLEPPKGANRYTVTVPAGVPACDRCVLRWEWIAVQQVSNIEFYSSCTDVQVTNPNGVGRVLTGVVTIGVTTGIEHLPSNINAYRRAYDGQFGEQYLVGPKLATYQLVGNNGVTSTITVTPTSTSAGVATSTAAATTSATPTTTSAATTTAAPVGSTCNFNAPNGAPNVWAGGFVVNEVAYGSAAANTVVEWDWPSGAVSITNIWNAVVDTTGTTSTHAKIRTRYAAKWGFQGTGNYGIANLKVNGVACTVSGATTATTATPTTTQTTTPAPSTTPASTAQTSTSTGSAPTVTVTVASTVVSTVTNTVTATRTITNTVTSTAVSTVTTTALCTTSASSSATPASTTSTTPSATPTSSTPTATQTQTGAASCSFQSSGAVIDAWNGGFVVNNAIFANGAQGTVVEWDWTLGPVTITNIWNAAIDTTYTTTSRVRLTQLYAGSTFGFQGNGAFQVANLKINGVLCGSAVTSATATPTATATITSTPSGTGGGLRYVGLNAGGLDFGTSTLPGVINVNYIAPKTAAIDYWISQGANVFRLPFAWERLQATKGGAVLDGPAAQVIDTLITYCTSRGVSVILDPHNNDQGVSFMKQAVTKQDLAALWSAIATKYSTNQFVIFGLYNEPMNNGAQYTVATWLDWAQTSVNAIRATGAANLILVPGVFWTGAHSWASLNDGMKAIVDSGNNVAYDMHQYFDWNYSGTTDGCSGAAGALAGVQSATQWLQANNKRGFLGEFNAKAPASSSACKDAVYAVLDHMKANNAQWLGFAVWVFAPWGIGMNVYDTAPINNAEWFFSMNTRFGS